MWLQTWWLLLAPSKAAFTTFWKKKKKKTSMKRLQKTAKRKQRSMAGISTMFFSSGATGVLTSQERVGRDKYIYMTCRIHLKLVCSIIGFTDLLRLNCSTMYYNAMHVKHKAMIIHRTAFTCIYESSKICILCFRFLDLWCFICHSFRFSTHTLKNRVK